MELVVSRRFDRDLRKLLNKNPQLKKPIAKTLLLLQRDHHHPSLRIHKLSGTQNYSFSVDMSIRIIAHLDSKYIYLLRIGDHNAVY